MNIVGISAYFHDSACCVLKDGVLAAAAEEERFSRVKHDSGLPWLALRSCLQDSGLSLADVDCIAFYESPAEKASRQIWMALQCSATSRYRQKIPRYLDLGWVERDLRTKLGYDGRFELVTHHEAHAASAYYFSGYDDAAVLICDGVGEWATTSYGRAAGDDIELFEQVHFPHSLGLLYSAVTGFLGFRVNDGEYKVMGLAPYGEPRFKQQVRALISSGDDGQFRLNMEYFDFITSDRMYSDRFAELFGVAPRPKETELLQVHKDIARSVQAVLEEILCQKAAYLHRRAPSKNLCMAGGVALNCVANSRILRDGPFENLFVQPAASDAGACLGAAALVHRRLTGSRPRQGRLRHMNWGPKHGLPRIRRLLDDAQCRYESYEGDQDGLVEAVATRLAAGQVIGWFHGRMEFGPRALGARSILADPRGPEMRDRINALVKMREAFRPFAPASIEERAHEHFDIDHPSPFMIEICQVSSKLSLPAVTHVDNTARLQTVDAEVAPRYHALIARFGDKTGCPILLNTSFNLRGEPIVATPEEAVQTFVRSQIDALVLEDFVIDKKDIPPSWPGIAGLLPPPNDELSISGDVYTFV